MSAGLRVKLARRSRLSLNGRPTVLASTDEVKE
jgi:hypothetical protein